MSANDLPPEELLRRGIWSLNRYRRETGALPEVGEYVDYAYAPTGCARARVVEVRPSGALTLRMAIGTKYERLIEDVEYDADVTAVGHWHWRCERFPASESAESYPSGPTIVINIDGKQLFRLLEEQALRSGRRRPRPTFEPLS